MAKLFFSLPTFALILLILIPSSAGRAMKPENSNDGSESESPPRTWCVAKPSASDEVLLANINFACEKVGFDCHRVNPGQSCFLPDTIISHASVAMNYYYLSAHGNPSDCDFAGTGLITTTDPSHGSCSYPYYGLPPMNEA